MIPRVVTNSTCLIVLERVQRLDLLPRVFGSILAPPAVEAEVGAAIPGVVIQALRSTDVSRVLRTQLGPGEAEAIALALELEDAVVLLDDKKARRIAQELGVRVIGTVGMLVRARSQGVMEAVAPVLAALEDAGFHLSPALHREALLLAGEASPGDTG